MFGITLCHTALSSATLITTLIIKLFRKHIDCACDGPDLDALPFHLNLRSIKPFLLPAIKTSFQLFYHGLVFVSPAEWENTH
jgi:hypothetical protein